MSHPAKRWCSCQKRCHGGKEVSRSAWFTHAQYRNPPPQPLLLLAGPSIHATQAEPTTPEPEAKRQRRLSIQSETNHGIAARATTDVEDGYRGLEYEPDGLINSGVSLCSLDLFVY
ncbi:hypothetical protein CPB83DRAFT_233946 [Crepidotus variabilis]|uniref:Uncharacterized protein n=1 Tax=Crepidotus variabilis TaxID=179855 RepID=A0A9P6ES87_9AGAR|nr:hypothetical protein CPB83DRAFT_233946 [Crepidotus variabilis]